MHVCEDLKFLFYNLNLPNFYETRIIILNFHKIHFVFHVMSVSSNEVVKNLYT